MQKKSAMNLAIILTVIATGLITIASANSTLAVTNTPKKVYVKSYTNSCEGGSTHGGGGGKIPDACQTAEYGEWGACVNGTQFRDIIKLNGQVFNPTTNVSICRITAEQQTARMRSCVANDQQENKEPQKAVLGVTKYADGTLLRTPDHRIYAIIGGKKHYVANLQELARDYFGVEILDVSFDVVNEIPNE